MNKRQITNKTTKRIAIAAGATAAVLFLTAGFVSSRGNDSNNNDKADAPLAVVAAPVIETPAAPVVEEIAEELTVEAPASQVSESTSKSSSVKSTTSAKKSKSKRSAATAVNVVLNVPNLDSTVAVPEVVAAPAPQVAEAAVAETPAAPVAEQPAAPAVEQPAQAEQPAAATSAPASNQGTSMVRIPGLTMSDSFSKTLSNIDLTKSLTTVTKPKICIPGTNC